MTMDRVAAFRRGAAAMVVLVLATAPTATAVSPPPVDNTFLPAAAPPAPPQRTEQQEPCFHSAAAAADRRPKAPHGLDLAAVWRLTRGAGQSIAVVDTGVARHRLLPRLVAGGDYVHVGDGTDDCDGHGTMVAGLIAASPGAGHGGFTGVAPDASIIAIRQSSNKFRPADDPGSSGFGNVETLAMAIRTAADRGATVINVSSVACVPVTEAIDDRSLGAALAYAVDVKNAVVVAAAGNVGGPGQCPQQNPPARSADSGGPPDGSVTMVASPAWYDDLVLTVGSVGATGRPSEFSLAGPWVDVAAPGENVISLDPDGEGLIDVLPADGQSTAIAGTSYAAPIVTGVVALVRSRWPYLTARQVMSRVEDTARQPASGWNPLVGHGVIDALAAVSGDGPVAGVGFDGEPPVATAPPPRVPRDPRAGRIAFGGAFCCVAIAAAVALASAGRSRRREAVPQD